MEGEGKRFAGPMSNCFLRISCNARLACPFVRLSVCPARPLNSQTEKCRKPKVGVFQGRSNPAGCRSKLVCQFSAREVLKIRVTVRVTQCSA